MRQQHGERGLGQPKFRGQLEPVHRGPWNHELFEHGHPARRRDYELFEREHGSHGRKHEQQHEPVDRLGQLDGIGLDDEHGGSAF